jgi:hypothetical protein
VHVRRRRRDDLATPPSLFPSVLFLVVVAMMRVVSMAARDVHVREMQIVRGRVRRAPGLERERAEGRAREIDEGHSIHKECIGQLQ